MPLTTRRAALGLSLTALRGAATLAAATFAARSVAAQVAWHSYTYVPAETQAPARGVARIAEAMKADGLTLRAHLGGSLPINASNITQAVADNTVQFGDDGFFQGNVPIGGVTRLPMLMTTADEMAQASAIVLPYLEAAYAKKNIVLLGYYHYPVQSAWSRKKLASLDEFKGSKMRVTSAEQGEFVRRFGGVPITIGAAEVPSALDRGVVDGVFTAASGGGRIWKDLLKYQYGIGPNYFDAVLIANKDAFDKLTAAQQAKLRQLAQQAAQWITAETMKEEDEVTVQLKAAGMTMTPASARDIAAGSERMAGYWDEWAKSRGPQAVEVLAKIRAALKR